MLSLVPCHEIRGGGDADGIAPGILSFGAK
jgi:hypothetical protein